MGRNRGHCAATHLNMPIGAPVNLDKPTEEEKGAMAALA
jgi:hypothetical protein